ncbi:TonB-dependent receptor (plasmid) [Pedobacter sp. BS3]|uniref:SusC/RagA family TonB-linked outer membrane protein n=1 Tax=Pedobacter sp. BS3 TaxID=2567937 RepID=UPI0011EBCE10|nr:TonB-dependent receptor [Pedobacter sp. BS3]TZF86487.1 TonB-dependent receptor [Pedobacter sp. BS3]
MNKTIMLRRRRYVCSQLLGLIFLIMLNANTEARAAATSSFREDIRVTGVVRSSDGEPLVGVSVKIKGTNKGVNTNTEGRYSINAPSDGVLVFTYLGFQRREVRIAGKPQLDVVLESTATALDEVVVVGYGTMQKSDVTGAISSVKLKDVDETKAVSFAEALQGKVAGVNIVTNTGEPGGAITFNIRGMTSVTGSNQPLIVIDGQPVESSFDATYAGSNLDGTVDAPPADPLAMLNPNDIESIEILKDASSTAIYGSRGANGVVLVTTKSGKAGKDQTTFSSRFDISQLPKQIPMLSNYEYMLYKNEAAINSAILNGTTPTPVYNQAQLDSVARLPNTNWQDEVYRNAFSQDYQVSFTGSERNKYNYLLSGNYADQQSIILNAGFKRGGLRLNYERNISPKIKVGLRSFVSLADRKFGLQSNWTGILSGTTVLGALAFNPLQIPYTGDEDDEIDQALQNNPLTLIYKVTDRTAIRTFISNFSLDYKITPYLSYQLRAGVNDIYSRRNVYYPTGTWLGDTAPDGYATRADNDNYNYLIDNLLMFKKVFARKHSINAVGGFSWQQWFNSSSSVINMSFPSNTLTYYNMAGAAYPGRYYNTDRDRALESIIGRINYTYDKRYSIMATGRYDGSTRLSPGHKWLLYPSVGLAWNVSNEDFFKEQVKFMSSLKLRASVGVAGNDNIAIGGSQASYALNYYPIGSTIVPGYVVNRFENPDLTWEKTTQYNLGGDFGFLKDKLTLTVDAYSKVTTGLLINLSLPASAGIGSYYTNVGKVTNRGIDFEATYNVFSKKNKSLSLSANISPVDSKINNLGSSSIIYGRGFFAGGGIVLGQPVTAAVPGQAISSFWGYKTNGIYQNQAEIDNDPALANDNAKSSIHPGMVKYVDLNGDGQITDADKTVIGDATPDFTYGFSANFTYKKFSASMTLFGSYGAQLLNLNRWMLGSGHANTSMNMMKDAYEGRWYGEGTSNLYPALTTEAVRLQQRFPDWMVEDASFLRLQNITLGYTLSLPKRYRLGDIKLSVTGTNLFTLTKYTGYDPNVNSFGQNSLNNGIDLGTLPQARSYSATVKLMF